jgi:hypothetical protein
MLPPAGSSRWRSSSPPEGQNEDPSKDPLNLAPDDPRVKARATAVSTALDTTPAKLAVCKGDATNNLSDVSRVYLPEKIDEMLGAS